MIKLIVGLGNPGTEYERTRHNIAWQLFEKLSFYNRLNWREKYKGLMSDISIEGEKIVLLKPQTFMNLSGESVQPCAKFFKILPEEILVVHDELDLDFGTIAFKSGGGLAGHNGLKSINQLLGTNNFKRLRLGIGRPVHGNVSSYVLSSYDNDESIAFDTYMEKAGDAIESCLKIGFEKAANRYSKKKLV
tara:strand:- start:65415 stop:65984 length:570 start_codon:yes stop_codon:yes gene_type:complete